MKLGRDTFRTSRRIHAQRPGPEKCPMGSESFYITKKC